MITIFPVYYTNHALEKIDALGIERKEIDTTLTQGMKWKEPHTDKWHASMAGMEVVFIKEENSIVVITIYQAEGKK